MKEYLQLNSQLNLVGSDGKPQFEKDKEALANYIETEVKPRDYFLAHEMTLKEKYNYLNENMYIDSGVVCKYGSDFFFDLVTEIEEEIGQFGFFETFMSAYKFYQQYALKSRDGQWFLENICDRIVLTAVAYSSSKGHAEDMAHYMAQKRFQPATPTFLNAGRVAGGEAVSCYLLRVEDNMESIGASITNSLQLSKRGGGVALLLTNLREAGAPIQGIENQSSGVIPVMKLLEDAFSYANQLGARQGAGAVYLNAHHPDILKFLDTKRENADEKIRIKTLSLGVVIPDITFELAQRNEDMYLFSPYDIYNVTGEPLSDLSVTEHYYEWVKNPDIKKTKISARRLFQTLAEIQFESGYPYILFEDTANKYNWYPEQGRINMSNLCSEILQVNSASHFFDNGDPSYTGMDIACNLGSFNVAKMMECESFKDFHQTVMAAVKFLTNVSESVSNNNDFPVRSIRNGAALTRSIGLGQMNLHGYLITQGIEYGSLEAIDFFRRYMALITYCAESATMETAKLTGKVASRADQWQYIEKIRSYKREASMLPQVGQGTPEWFKEDVAVRFEELFYQVKGDLSDHLVTNMYLQAIPPTGSISYLTNATPGIQPATDVIETRKEGKTGRTYVPTYGVNKDNYQSITTAYNLDQQRVIDMYAAATPWVDQGISAVLFYPNTATTRDVVKNYIYAHKQGLKTLYYMRVRQQALPGTEVAECVSCVL